MSEYNLNLHVVVAYPSSDFFGEVTKAQITMIAVGCGILVFALIVGVSYKIFCPFFHNFIYFILFDLINLFYLI